MVLERMPMRTKNHQVNLYSHVLINPFSKLQFWVIPEGFI